MLPKKYRLNPKDFNKIYTRGLKYRGKYGMLVITESTTSPTIGFVLNKKIGNAVHRHRMTRLLRVIMMEIVKEMKLEETKIKMEYIAFEFCDSKDILKEDCLNLFTQALKK